MKLNRLMCVLALVASMAASVTFASDNAAIATTSRFAGPKANSGMAVFYKQDGKAMLRVTDDFKVPDTPAPTWRVVTSRGEIYTLDAFKIKAGKGEKRQVQIPPYVIDIAKVQVYCAWAEIILGEASFAQPVK